jgi:transporter family-2 protein
LISVQVACNGSIGRVGGTPWAAAFFNFATGSATLALVWGVSGLVKGRLMVLPPVWWMYLGGVIGVTIICLHSWLVRHIGVLALGLAAVTGQLCGALALRTLVPGRSPVTVLVVVGTLVAIAGAVIAALPSGRRKPPGVA